MSLPAALLSMSLLPKFYFFLGSSTKLKVIGCSLNAFTGLPICEAYFHLWPGYAKKNGLDEQSFYLINLIKQKTAL